MDITFHYPPELLNLLIDTIPLLSRSKRDVLLFFRGAGVPYDLWADLEARVDADKESITKYEIVRTILQRLNEKGEATLRERREVLRRVTEFEDFSTCWPEDQLKAEGLVAKIRRVVDIKDSFTRMKMEREKERRQREADHRAKLEQAQQRRAELSTIRQELFSLFSEQDHHKRGKALEDILNSLFKVSGILVREAFALTGDSGQGIVEQIDGVVEIDGWLYLVEMKWWDQPLGRGEVSQHLIKIFSRGQTRGIFISASGYTDAAVATCREALQRAVCVLCELQELVSLLEQEGDLKEFLKAKINAAALDKNPLYRALETRM